MMSGLGPLEQTDPGKHKVGYVASVHRALLTIYILLAAYGITGLAGGFLTVFLIYGPIWGTVWPALVCVTSVGAIIGLYVTRRTGRTSFESWATLGLILSLLFYALGIVLRNVLPDLDPNTDLSKVGYAFLPLAACVAPYFRVIDIFPDWRHK